MESDSLNVNENDDGDDFKCRSLLIAIAPPPISIRFWIYLLNYLLTARIRLLL